MNELKILWGKLLGTIPGDSQFDFWAAMHSPETIHHGILKTAQKNLSIGSTMSDDHKTRFASRVMLSSTAQAAGQNQSTAQPTQSAGVTGGVQ
jgi:hypothetical protein